MILELLLNDNINATSAAGRTMYIYVIYIYISVGRVLIYCFVSTIKVKL